MEIERHSEKYSVIRSAMDPLVCKLLKDALLMTQQQYFAKKSEQSKQELESAERRALGEQQLVSRCFSFYGLPFTDALLLAIQPIVETVWGEKLAPTYSFSRIYSRGAVLKRHVDRPACEYSVSACIDVEGGDPWSIWVDESEVVLEPGDILFYKGMEVQHWREPCECRRQIQLFLHYVAVNGPHIEHKFDKRPMLGLDSQCHQVS